MEFIYQEKQKTYFIVIAVYIVVAFFLLGLILWPEFYNFKQASLYSKIILIGVTIIDIILFWSFSELKIKLTKEFLEIRFGVFKKRIKLSEIKEAYFQDLNKKNFLGYGIRIGRDKTVGYIARGGRGVMLKMLPRNYFFTSDNPEEIVKLILQNK